MAQTEICYQPWKKLVIRELMEYELDEWYTHLIHTGHFDGNGILSVLWCKGFAFLPLIAYPSNATAIEEIKGNLYFNSVSFARKEHYQYKDIVRGSTIKFDDVSKNNLFIELTDYLAIRSPLKQKPKSSVKSSTNSHDTT